MLRAKALFGQNCVGPGAQRGLVVGAGVFFGGIWMDMTDMTTSNPKET